MIFSPLENIFHPNANRFLPHLEAILTFLSLSGFCTQKTLKQWNKRAVDKKSTTMDEEQQCNQQQKGPQQQQQVPPHPSRGGNAYSNDMRDRQWK